MRQFLDLLFSPAAVTCYTESPFGYKVKTHPRKSDLFFCINELYPDRDNNPTKDWHDPSAPRRADANVATFRNFLLEIDDMPLDDQIAYVKSRVPVSTIVYSGGSSYHFIISLEEPLPDYETYMHWARRLLMLVPKADKMCKNPSRLSRLPGRLRLDTGKMQKLMFVGERVNNMHLDTILPSLPVYEKKERSQEEVREYITPLLIEASITPDDFMAKRNIHSRNGLFFYLGKRMEEINMGEEKKLSIVERTYNNLKDIEDFPFEEALLAARVRE